MKPRLARVIRIGTFVSALVIAGTATANEPINLAVDNEDTEIDANERSPVAAALTSETPPGFEDLADPMPVVVDIYFGGRLIGTTSGVQEPGYFTFDEPDKVVALISDLDDPATVVAALSGRLASNAGLVCGPNPREGCGELSPQVAGIIHDQAGFRLDIIIAPEFFAAPALNDDRFLPLPDAGLSLISNFAGSVAGVEGRAASYSLQNRSILGWRNARVIAETAQSSNLGFQTQQLVAGLDTEGLRYRGGLMFSEPLAFTGQARVYGASIGTQYDTRADAEDAFTQPIVLFLPRRAQINAYRDGRLLASRLYEAGNQLFDTAAFPAGAYNVTFEIIDDSGATRTEQRFFTKDRRLPPVGKTAFSMTAGALAMDRRDALPDFGDDLFLQGTIGHRIAPNLSLEGGALLVGSDFVTEAGGSFLADGFTARLMGLAGNEGNYGLIANVSWFDLRDVSVNGFFRRTWGPGFGVLSSPDRLGLTPINDVNLLVGNSTQAGGNIGMRLGDVNLRFDGLYFKSLNSDAFYSYGPSFDYAFRAGRNAQLTFFGDGRRSSEGWDARIGIRLNFIRDNFAVFGESAGAYRRRGGVHETGVVGNVLATYSSPGVLEGDLSVAAGYARDLDSERIRGEASLQSQYGRFLGQVEHAFDSPGGGTRYAANVTTSIAIGGGKATIGGSDIGQSGIVISLAGEALDLQVDVVIDNVPRARIRPGQSIPVFLPPYRTYAVRLVPVAGRGGRFDTDVRQVTIYAGNLANERWNVARVQAVFGRLIGTGGGPIANAIISGGRDFMQTDQDGYFQGEVAMGEEFVVRQGGKDLCRITLATVETDAVLSRLGDVACLP